MRLPPLRKIVPIVEGPGEVEAVPKLLSKIFLHLGHYDLVSSRAKKASGSSIIKDSAELERLLSAAEEEDNVLGILILIDADDECPFTLAAQIAGMIKAISTKYFVEVVVANREYEVWFLASLSTVRGEFGIAPACEFSGNIEEKSDVKGWLTKQMPKGKPYKETTHQVLMTQKINVATAHQNSRSFRRLVHAVELLVAAADINTAAISP